MEDPAPKLLHPITPALISAALHEHAGLTIAPESIKLEHRHGRWFARLKHDLLLFAAETPETAARLSREGNLLRMLAQRVPFAVPRVHDIAPGLQLRSPVPGSPLAGNGRERDFAEQPQGTRLAAELGKALAHLHGAFTLEEAEGFGFSATEPVLPPADALQEGLLRRPEYLGIAATADRLLARYGETRPAATDIVLVHGDIWGGNLAVDLETGALNGLFDFADAGLADRHLDLMYIHSFGPAFAERVFRAYEEAGSAPVSRHRTALYHAIAAFAALADMADKGEDYLLQQRRRWVAEVCSGPIAQIALKDR